MKNTFCLCYLLSFWSFKLNYPSHKSYSGQHTGAGWILDFRGDYEDAHHLPLHLVLHLILVFIGSSYLLPSELLQA